MMAQLLTLEGYEAATVANGREALDYLHGTAQARRHPARPDDAGHGRLGVPPPAAGRSRAGAPSR